MDSSLGHDPRWLSFALMRNVLSAFDEYTSLETAKHVTRSMLENARRGFWNGAKPPFGYRTVTVEKHGNKEKKKLETEPKEAEIVRLIFQLYLFGDGTTGPLGIKNWKTPPCHGAHPKETLAPEGFHC